MTAAARDWCVRRREKRTAASHLPTDIFFKIVLNGNLRYEVTYLLIAGALPYKTKNFALKKTQIVLS